MNTDVWPAARPRTPGGAMLALALSALLSVMLMVTGCGPTTGGTGTGSGAPIPLSTFGATAANVCTAPFASAIGCGSTTGIVTEPGAALAGAGVFFVGSNASGPFVLSLQGNTALLQSRCRATEFSGEYGVLASGEGRHFGRYVAADRSDAAASLALQAVPERTDTLQLLVRAVDNSALFGPLQVTKVDTAPTEPAQCP